MAKQIPRIKGDYSQHKRRKVPWGVSLGSGGFNPSLHFGFMVLQNLGRETQKMLKCTNSLYTAGPISEYFLSDQIFWGIHVPVCYFRVNRLSDLVVIPLSQDKANRVTAVPGWDSVNWRPVQGIDLGTPVHSPLPDEAMVPAQLIRHEGTGWAPAAPWLRSSGSL
jgi:hypothetical protein